MDPLPATSGSPKSSPTRELRLNEINPRASPPGGKSRSRRNGTGSPLPHPQFCHAHKFLSRCNKTVTLSLYCHAQYVRDITAATNERTSDSQLQAWRKPDVSQHQLPRRCVDGGRRSAGPSGTFFVASWRIRIMCYSHFFLIVYARSSTWGRVRTAKNWSTSHRSSTIETFLFACYIKQILNWNSSGLTTNYQSLCNNIGS